MRARTSSRAPSRSALRGWRGVEAEDARLVKVQRSGTSHQGMTREAVPSHGATCRAGRRAGGAHRATQRSIRASLGVCPAACISSRACIMPGTSAASDGMIGRSRT